MKGNGATAAAAPAAVADLAAIDAALAASARALNAVMVLALDLSCDTGPLGSGRRSGRVGGASEPVRRSGSLLERERSVLPLR